MEWNQAKAQAWADKILAEREGKMSEPWTKDQLERIKSTYDKETCETTRRVLRGLAPEAFAPQKPRIEGDYDYHYAVIRGALIMNPELAERVGFVPTWAGCAGVRGPIDVLSSPAFSGWGGSYRGESEIADWLRKIAEAEEEDKRT